MRAQGLVFDQVIASPATRVVETLADIADGYGRSLEPRFDGRIYLATTETLLDIVQEADDGAERLLIVGHNPGLEMLAMLLTSGEGLRTELAVKYPTATVAEISLPVGQWRDVAEGIGTLARFIRPRADMIFRISRLPIGSLAVQSVLQRLSQPFEILGRVGGMLIRGCRTGRCNQVLAVAGAAGQQLLNAPDGIAILVEEPVDALGKCDVGRAVIAAIPGPLERPQLGKARFPIAKDMLRDSEVVGEFADSAECLVAFARLRQELSCP
jgi:phosphohistidine phosphatase